MLLFLRVTLMWDFLWHQVQVRTDSVVFNLMDDGEYWNHRPFFFMTFLFLFVSCADVADFCSPQCMLTEPLFYSKRTFTARIWSDFAEIPLWWQSACDFSSVAISKIWMTMVVIPVHALHYFWVCWLCAYLHMWLQSWKVLWNGMSWPLSACGAVNSTWFGDINAVPSFLQTPVEGVRGYPVGSNPRSNPTRPGDSGKYRLMAHKAVPLIPLLIRF